MKKLPLRVSKRKSKETPKSAALRIIKLKGETSVPELCRALNLTQTAVRRCLSSLERSGLVEHKPSNQGQGRPLNAYRLTTSAVSEFPNGYEQLSQNIVDTLFQRGGHAAVMDFLKINNDRIIATLSPQFSNKSLKERVEAISEYFTANGYMSDWMPLPDGNFFLYNQNCAVYNLANKYRQFCILEPRLIESLVGFKITRQQYILKDQPVCGYVIDRQRPVDARKL